jgi:hypothetical protein
MSTAELACATASRCGPSRGCGRACSKSERGLAARHIVEWAKAPELRFAISNGMTLCRECHMRLHRRPIREARLVLCACGCGTLISSIDRYGRPRRYVNRHGEDQP